MNTDAWKGGSFSIGSVGTYPMEGEAPAEPQIWIVHTTLATWRPPPTPSFGGRGSCRAANGRAANGFANAWFCIGYLCNVFRSFAAACWEARPPASSGSPGGSPSGVERLAGRLALRRRAARREARPPASSGLPGGSPSGVEKCFRL
jgi:hypothetical protein